MTFMTREQKIEAERAYRRRAWVCLAGIVFCILNALYSIVQIAVGAPFITEISYFCLSTVFVWLLNNKLKEANIASAKLEAELAESH